MCIRDRLAALTEADSIATGPSAWSRNKAHLINKLASATEDWLNSGGQAEPESSFPDAEQLAFLNSTNHAVVGEGNQLRVVTPDRPGLFARVAGALALSNLSIVDAQIHVEGAKALEVFHVVNADQEEATIAWGPAMALIEEILAGTDDLTPRFEAREKSFLRRTVQAPQPIEVPRVDFDNEVSAESTVIEVAGPDRLGLLYEVSRAIVNAGLDTQQAFVQTVGGDVVDSFYVQKLDGTKLIEPAKQEELRDALLAVLEARG